MHRLTFPILLAILFSYISCESTTKKERTADIKNGEELSKRYCSSCHQYSEPDLLDKASWENSVLPRMGYMLGFFDGPNKRQELINEGGFDKIFPTEPILEKSEWEAIKNHYLSNAPEKLVVPNPKIQIGLKNFKVKVPEFKVTPPSSTLVKFMDDKTIFVGDALSKKLLQFDAQLNFLKSGNMAEGVVHIEEINDEYWILNMGSFTPTDRPTGLLLNLPKSEKRQARVIADQLRRPVHASYGDLNNDGKIDIIISEFAKWTGRLSLLINKGNKAFEQITLANQTGATKTFIRDFNNDGLLDIIALFAQGNEGISIFYNQGNLKFKREDILQFSPSHGSTSFELIDLENDGDIDILYTAGDNADFKPILKPYHGIYIFENNGKNQFKKKFFHHMNGAYGAKMVDFDLDGDLDIAAISFFPDYKNGGKESFVFLENIRDFSFEASSFENNTRGRWIVMDIGDIDEDEDMDIILGSLTFEVIPDLGYTKKWIDEGLPFIFLENQTKK